MIAGPDSLLRLIGRLISFGIFDKLITRLTATGDGDAAGMVAARTDTPIGA